MRQVAIVLIAALFSFATACGSWPVIGSGPSGAGSPSTRTPPGRTSAPAPAKDSDWMVIEMTGQRGLDPVFRERGVGRGYNVGAHAIDKNHDGSIDDPLAFRRLLAKQVPRDFEGIVSLDWEVPIGRWLKTPPSSPEFTRAVANLRELLRLARLERPKAKFGFYGLPLREYWNRDDAWRTRGLALGELFAEVDWIGVSVYVLYRTEQSPSVTRARQKAYTQECIELALECAQRAGGKPVLPFINHRYVPNNKQLGQQLIPAGEFRTALRDIKTASFNGDHVAGLVWWGADAYYHRQGQVRVEGHAPSALRRVHREYLDLILAEARN